MCERETIDPLTATREDVGRYVRQLAERPAPVGPKVVSIDSGAGFSNATMQQRLVSSVLFFDLLVEDVCGCRTRWAGGRLGRCRAGRRPG
jgi:integrase/recombinase XerD